MSDSGVEAESRLKWGSEGNIETTARLGAELPQGCGGSFLTPVASLPQPSHAMRPTELSVRLSMHTQCE